MNRCYHHARRASRHVIITLGTLAFLCLAAAVIILALHYAGIGIP